jgi:hypothetical protein
VDLHFDFPRNILGVAADNPRAELLEALADQQSVFVESLRRVDQVAGIEVDGKGFAVDRVDHFPVGFDAVRQCPAHHLVAELGAHWLDGINDLAGVFDRCVEELVREIVRMRPVPDVLVVRTGDVYAASRVECLGQGETVDHALQILRPLLVVSVQEIAPAAHLGNDHIMLLKGSSNLSDAVLIVQIDRWAVGGPITQAVVGDCQLFRILRWLEDRSPQPDRRPGTPGRLSRCRMCENRADGRSRGGGCGQLQETAAVGGRNSHAWRPGCRLMMDRFGSVSLAGRRPSALLR